MSAPQPPSSQTNSQPPIENVPTTSAAPPGRFDDEKDGQGQFQELLSARRSTVQSSARSAPDPDVTDTRIVGVVIGLLVGLTEEGQPMVDYPGNPFDQPLPAASTWRCQAKDGDTSVALLFESGDPSRPMIVGPIVEPVNEPREIELSSSPRDASKAMDHIHVEQDGQELLLTADKQITLRCGQASVTLTRAGKILLRGTYLLSRSSGANRIKGGSVQIN